MYSRSPYRFRHSRASTLSTTQHVENSQRSRKDPGGTHSSGVRNGGVGRRRSVPSKHHLKTPNIHFTALAAQKTTNNEKSNVINMDDDNEYNDDQVKTLNLSSASAATENLESSRNSAPISVSTSSDNINNAKNSTIAKHELLARYFKKINTGDYYCMLCKGTKDANRVSFFYISYGTD